MSHYWDCRLKGRPPGTAKSDDPNKKKRKRQARERDLCDVKIKITEFFPGARAAMGESNPGVSQPGTNNLFGPAQQGASMLNDGTFRMGPPGADGSRYYTIQRVNGGNGQVDGAGGGHKHTLDESDRVKRNSIQRHTLKEEKVKRRFQVSTFPSLVLGPIFRNDPSPISLDWSNHSTCCHVNVDVRCTSISVARPQLRVDCQIRKHNRSSSSEAFHLHVQPARHLPSLDKIVSPNGSRDNAPQNAYDSLSLHYYHQTPQ